eukprot:gene17977-biopygen1741
MVREGVQIKRGPDWVPGKDDVDSGDVGELTGKMRRCPGDADAMFVRARWRPKGSSATTCVARWWKNGGIRFFAPKSCRWQNDGNIVARLLQNGCEIVAKGFLFIGAATASVAHASISWSRVTGR